MIVVAVKPLVPLLLLTGVVGVAVPTLLIRGSQPVTPAATGPSNGTGTVNTTKTPDAAKEKEKDDKGVFTISGSVTQLVPGGSKPLTVTISNPNGYAIDVMTIAATVAAPNPGCPASALSVAPYTYTGGTKVTAPGKGSTTMTLTAQYVDSTSVNTSACNGATFPLTFTGTADKASNQ